MSPRDQMCQYIYRFIKKHIKTDIYKESLKRHCTCNVRCSDWFLFWRTTRDMIWYSSVPIKALDVFHVHRAVRSCLPVQRTLVDSSLPGYIRQIPWNIRILRTIIKNVVYKVTKGHPWYRTKLELVSYAVSLWILWRQVPCYKEVNQYGYLT